MPSLGIAPHPEGCTGPFTMPAPGVTSASGAMPTDGSLRRLEIGGQAVQLSPYHTGPADPSVPAPGPDRRTHRHMPVKEQRDALAHKLRGHYGYYGITGNAWMLGRFLYAVTRRWRYWLNRRSQRGKWSWERFARFLRVRPLPPPVSTHSILRYA